VISFSQAPADVPVVAFAAAADISALLYVSQPLAAASVKT